MILKNENMEYNKLTEVSKIEIDGYTGKSKLLKYRNDYQSILMTNRDKEFLYVIDVTDPENASIV